MAKAKAKSVAKIKSVPTKVMEKSTHVKEEACNMKWMQCCPRVKGIIISVGTLLGYWHQIFLLIPLIIGISMVAKSYLGWCCIDNALKSCGYCCGKCNDMNSKKDSHK